MRILIINGSHRQEGNTARFSQFAKTIFEGKGHNAEILNLIDNRFDICNGCLTCEETSVCTINDKFTIEIIPKLMQADMYVFATPVYFNMPTSLFKNFIDRTNCLCEFYSENKKNVACFLVGQADEESLSFAFSCINEYIKIMGFELQGNQMMKIARDENDLILDEEIKKSILSWCE